MARIDENTARTAWNGIHFADYKPGQATREWESMCDKCDEVADKAIERAPERVEEIERLRERYHDRAAAYINERNRIDAMCPSVLITGAGNFPTRKKQRQNARMDSFYSKDWGFDTIIHKLRTIGTDREPIKSGDANALDRLRAKLEKREKMQDRMKAANAAIRLKDTAKGDERLHAMDYSDEEIKALRDGTNDFCGRIGYPPYMLSNNSAEIRRIRKRIEKLEAEKQSASEGNKEHSATVNGEPCTIVENADIMRLQLFFDGKPEADTREQLKRAGLRWAPSQGAWQRQLTNNARYSVRRIATFEKVENDENDKHDESPVIVAPAPEFIRGQQTTFDASGMQMTFGDLLTA